MNFPPSKRLKGRQVPADPDPFEDDIDFTQDDLEQMDIMASQAFGGDGQSCCSKRAFGSAFSSADEQSKAPARSGRKTFAIGDGSGAFNSKDAFAEGHSSKDGEDLYYKQLEQQQAELKKKLKEVEEDILMKNGEIRVLRDSLKQANQEKERQRQTQLALENQTARAQSDREKELSRKVQSLQSELHFKEAEMNEMRGRLQSAERGGKLPGTPARNTVQSPVSRAFMTKENISASFSKKISPVKKASLSEALSDSEAALTDGMRPLEVFSSSSGRVLLTLLLQQPLDPSALSLCHLLSISPDAPPNILAPHAGSLVTSSSSCTEFRWFHRPQARFHQLQSLASSALNALALHHPDSAPHAPASSLRAAQRSCPAAVRLLPLLSFHIGSYCQSLESSAKASLHGGGSLSGASDSGLASSVEGSLSGPEELALAALGALGHVVRSSSEALEEVLCPPEDVNRSQASKHLLGASEHLNGDAPTQLPLLRRILQLADPAFSTAAGQREALVSTSLKTLGLLAERARDNQLLRLQVVMSSQVLSKCLTLETSNRIVLQSVRFLSLIIYNEEVAIKLCSHEYPCPFLKMFQYIASRPDKCSSEDGWSRLELEVVRLLTKLFAQKTGTWAALCQSSCQCINEVVRTVVVVLHRQWLKTKGRGSRSLGGRGWTGPGSQVLREALMLLHWLLLNDSSFSEHCLDVLHMYDQVVPAVRDTLRLVPDLSESEELALEEICRSETEYVEDMDVETGS
ncbi:ATR-interacting protein isoform X2 [Puntigrus tetrazona]|uniref:ATR-interacting protein isoform X2 n=1 Tax=Puntigrus tetrazona TaxID=1606681 RepID=UPI001C8ADACA|nr:ATR-interacting protein isoform X2 [Puntigrus tetrazona]